MGMIARNTMGLTLLCVGLSTLTLTACATPPIQSNDTGGIIAWSPAAQANAREIAEHECARYGKYAVITSVHPWYGDYIAFQCRLPGRWGPRLR